MAQWLISAAAFVVAIGFLVAIHEFGHYWVARRLGVRVLRYSIGFGSKVFGWTSRKTGIEYWLAAIPLGGYVKMLDEREAPVADIDKPFAFNRVHPWRRIAIVAAGPGVNLLFAILAYWIVFMMGVPGIKPVISAPPADSLAARAGLQAGDEIRRLGDTPIQDWQQLRLGLIERALDHRPVTLAVVDGDSAPRNLTLDLSDAPADPDALFKQLGMDLYQPPTTPLIGQVMDGSPAKQAGLEPGDAIESLDGQSLQSPQALVSAVQAHAGQTVTLAVRRHGQARMLNVQLGSKKTEDGKQVGHLGAAITVDPAAWDAMRTRREYGPVEAVPAAIGKTWELSALTVRLMARMVIGQVSWHNVSGPIQIASFAGQTAQIGLVAFISFMALISVSLAVLNLLPIPVLDGGHLLYYAVEWIRGRPLSEAVQSAGQQVGMVALLMLMTVAFYNDILRLLG